MRNIAVFGGTFNPIHNGHVHLCLECHKQLHFDEMILIPAKVPPHKAADNLASEEHRLQMCRLAVQQYPEFRVSDIEFRQQGVSYTILTLEALKRQYPDDRLFLIIGSDMLYMFHQWYRYQDILSLVSVVAGARYPAEEERMRAHYRSLGETGENIRILPIQVIELSSTEIRRRIRDKQDLTGLLPAPVIQYIDEHHLYHDGRAVSVND